MDYQQISMNLLCGVLDALPQPTVLLNRNGQTAYVNPLGEELALSSVNFEENEAVVSALVDGVRYDSELISLTSGGVTSKGFITVYPIRQNDATDGALLFFRKLEQEGEVYPATLPYESEDMRDVYARIARLADINAAVLFLGETGVGKESFARLLHQQSQRARQRFISVDCRPGAGGLTALLQDNARCAECAAAGMLFLDGIHALLPNEQTVLEEIIHTKTIGGHTITARLCYSATPEMNAMAETGEFSAGLKVRVSLMGVAVPPLRDRQDDIPPLAKHYLKKYSKLYEKKIIDFSEEVWRHFLVHDWPENLRDLETIVRESVADCDGTMVTSIPLAATRQVSLRRERHKFSYKRIEALLSVYGTTTEGKRRAAKELGIGLSSLYRIIANYQRDKKWGRVE